MAINRRDFLRLGAQTAGAATTMSLLPASIQRALAVPAAFDTGTIQDVKHIVILMQENRSFDHYFGTLRGVRGFGDRFPIPLASGKPVWFESNGKRDIAPFHLDKNAMNAVKIHTTAHNFADSQAAWGQGQFGHWPLYKIDYQSADQTNGLSMGYYTRAEIPFQYALAEAFTLCDAYHCSVQSGTDPNRIMFWSGSNFDPALRAKGINNTDATSEPINLRCWVKGAFPDPGYTYRGSALTWPTIPDVLEQAGVRWRIYQDPNDNWTGAMNGCLAFESFRTAKPGSAIYRNGMSLWSLENLAEDVRNGTLPEVSWVLPTKAQSEHAAESSPVHGADFTSQVLEALTANPQVWSKTVFLLVFDENDGFFDHLPPPAVPSYNPDGSLAGKSTIPVDGMYFANDRGADQFHDEVLSDVASAMIGKRIELNTCYRDKRDTISGDVRPWGLGSRVPLYVISPWSKGGWVNSQVFDHTSVGQFLEKRFGITIPAISPWHRAVSGDLTSAFDFAAPNRAVFPELPATGNYLDVEKQQLSLPVAVAPAEPQPLYQEPGVRYSRALPYELHVDAKIDASRVVLTFRNTGKQGVVFHVYDKLQLKSIPRRYTVEAGKSLSDVWDSRASSAKYDLQVFAPNGFFRSFEGNTSRHQAAADLLVSYTTSAGEVQLRCGSGGEESCIFTVTANAYRKDGPWTLTASAGESASQAWSLRESGQWYDFTVTCASLPGYKRRFAGRMETGRSSTSDPA
jgi:phospholipase C